MIQYKIHLFIDVPSITMVVPSVTQLKMGIYISKMKVKNLKLLECIKELLVFIVLPKMGLFH